LFRAGAPRFGTEAHRTHREGRHWAGARDAHPIDRKAGEKQVIVGRTLDDQESWATTL
jgi:hypothetical protein